jgi:hypothetical protein
MFINDILSVIQNLKNMFFLKTDQDLADLLLLPKTTISSIKSRNAIGAMFEKIVAVDDDISLDAVFLAKDDQEVECYSLANKAILIARHDPVKLQDLSDLLENYVIINNNLKNILPLIQTIKGQNFITKLSEMWTGDGERMLIVLSRFLSYLQTVALEIKHPKEDFLNALQQFDISLKIALPIFNNVNMSIISEEDRTRLIKWVEDNLDDVSCYDMIASKSTIIDVVNNELNLLNQAVIKKVGVRPSIIIR